MIGGVAGTFVFEIERSFDEFAKVVADLSPAFTPPVPLSSKDPQDIIVRVLMRVCTVP